MVMQSLREGASGGFLKVILMGILVMAVGGLIMMDVGGFFRGGISQTDVARAGNEAIHINQFDRSLRRTLPRLGMGVEEAYQMGYVQQLLASEIRGLLVNQAAEDLDLNVGRKKIASEVQKIVEPMTSEGRDAQAVLSQLLLSQGMSEADFVRNMKREVENGILTSAVRSGFATVSDKLAEDMYLFQNEERDIKMVAFPASEFKDVKPPSEQQIANLYSAMREAYAIPERRQVSLIKIKSDELEKTISIPDAELRAVYDENIDMYSVPEERELEQAILSSEEDATAVADAVKSGKSLKDAVKSVTDEETAYLGSNNFQEDGLVEEISGQAFAASKGDMIGPVQTAFGHHVLVLKNIKAPKIDSFESVKANIKKELMQVRLGDQLYDMANVVDDILAGGGTLDDVQNEVEVKVIILSLLNSFGQGEDGKDAFADYKEYKDVALQSAFELFEGETSPVMEMSDGSFMAVHVESILPKSYKSIDEVREQIVAQWMSDQRGLSNKFAAVAHLTGIEEAGQTLEEFASSVGKNAQSLNNLTRKDINKSPLNQSSINQIFRLPVGDAEVIDINGGSAIVKVTNSRLPQAIDSAKVKTIKENLTRGAQEEGFQAYLQLKDREYGTVMNRQLLEQVYASPVQ